MLRAVRLENLDLFDGWLLTYLESASSNRFPLLFHALCGIWALTSIVGRKSSLRRSTYTLWPPSSVLLIGPSGIGKSQALRFALRVIEAASVKESTLYVARQYTTTAGMTEMWRKHQENSCLDRLEGAFMMDELVGNLRGTLGTENFTDWVIQVLEHDTVEKTTKKDGRVVVSGVTVGLGFGTTMAYLREGIDIHQFGGGFGWRFLLGYADKQEDRVEKVVSTEIFTELANQALAIRRLAPLQLSINPTADEKLKSYRIQASTRAYFSLHLDGWFNRYESMVARIAMALCLSRHAKEIEVVDIEKAKSFIDKYIQPPLLGIVEQLAAGPARADLYNIQESLMRALEHGIPNLIFLRMLPSDSGKRNKMIGDLVEMEYCFESKNRTKDMHRWFGTKDWKDQYDRG